MSSATDIIRAAVVIDGIITNIILCPPDFSLSGASLIQLSGQHAEIGFAWDGQDFTQPPSD